MSKINKERAIVVAWTTSFWIIFALIIYFLVK